MNLFEPSAEPLNAKWRIERRSAFSLAGHEVSAQEVIDRLAPHLTDERKKRIDQVIDQRTFNVATVVEHLYDVGNISAVMRSAESFGFLPFYIVERPGAKYKMSDRISRGSEKWLDIHRHSSTVEALSELRASGYKIYATDLQATRSIDEIEFEAHPSQAPAPKVAIVFGNEKDGISDEARALVDGCFKLPMLGFAQSFNISVAAALTFQIVYRARSLSGESTAHSDGLSGQTSASGDLSSEEKTIVRAHYYLRTLDGAEKYFLSS